MSRSPDHPIFSHCHPPFFSFCCKQRGFYKLTLGPLLGGAWVALGRPLRGPWVALGWPKPNPNPKISRGSQRLTKYQIPRTKYRFSLAASFVKDRPLHYFSALERIPKFTICSPRCQEKAAEGSVLIWQDTAGFGGKSRV